MKDYPIIVLPAYWRERDFVRADVEVLLKSMKRESSPGHPWIAIARTKGEVIDKHQDALIDAVLYTVKKWRDTPRGTLPEDPVQLVREGYVSPLRVFVKNEPHGREKISTGRLRIITSVAIHVVIAEMLVFGTQNNIEIDHWDEIPSAPGLGLAIDEHLRMMCDRVATPLAEGMLAEADVSGFDFSLTARMFELDAERRVKCAQQRLDSQYANAVYNAHHVLTRSVFALSDGRMFKQDTPGVMKSGRYVTSSTNSFIRVMLARSIGAPFCIAMGDDSLEGHVDDAVARYEELGIRVKFYKRCNETFEFCSHTFAGGIAWPTNAGKMLFNLLNQKVVGEDAKNILFQQWAFEMRHHPEIDEWATVIERLGWWAQDTTINGQKTRDEDEVERQI